MSARVLRNAVDMTAKTTLGETPTNTMMMAEKKDTSSSEELSMSTLEKVKVDLMKTMTETEATLVTNIFKKFTTESTDEDKMNGVVSGCLANVEESEENFSNKWLCLQFKLMMIAKAIEQNKTDDEITKMVEAFDSSEDKEMEPKKNITV